MALAVWAGLGCARPAPGAPERTPGAVVDGCRGVADGALCNDWNACTVDDRCVGGLCLGTIAPDGMSCTDDNQCTGSDMCARGKCQGAPVLDGTSCTDGDACTDPDTCRKGLCTSGGPLSCDDGDCCTADQCMEGDGCHHEPIPMCSDAAIGGDSGTPDADASPPDGAVIDVAPADADQEGPPDAVSDAPSPDAPSDDGEQDATDAPTSDGSIDAVDAPGDAGPDGGGGDILPLYQAQGGACVCSSTSGSPESPAALGVAVGAALLVRRRRRSAR